MNIAILSIYLSCIAVFALYAFSVVHIIYFWFKERLVTKKQVPEPYSLDERLPTVTVQIPMYNELYVAEGIIDAIANFDYPLDKLEIQVIDDSTDETTEIAEKRVAYWLDRGVDIKYIHRENRKGFKAGALAEATPLAKGEFICLFDADFLPDPDYLLRILPYFKNDKVGFAQARWEHLNPDYSLLTQVQAISIDAFFLIEQQGRYAADFLLRFNGSAGVWRKSCIEDAGGWAGDTLSEDLDLAYRAQLNGWKGEYAKDIECKAELPVTYADLRSQHYRWTKGKAEVNRKLLGKLWKTKLPFLTKLHAYADLLNIWAAVAIFVAAFVSIPVVFLLKSNPEYQTVLSISSIAMIHTFILIYYIGFTIHSRYHKKRQTVKQFARQFLPFVHIFMNISYHQFRAIKDTYMGKKTPFIRTPKYQILKKGDDWGGKRYKPVQVSKLDLWEYLFAIIFALAIANDIYQGIYGFIPFHVSLVISFLSSSILSVLERKKSRKAFLKIQDPQDNEKVAKEDIAA